MSNDNIIIINQEKLEGIKKKIIADGPNKLQVISEFDKTLTSCFVNGKKIASLISILRDEHYLTPDYSGKAQALYDKYHPFEIDPNLPIEEKKKLMHEWWSAHYKVLAQSGLNRNDLKKVAETEKVKFRPGAFEFLDFLNAHSVPLLIPSGAGLGVETISLFLEKYNRLYKNIFIASNTFVWDENGNFVRANEPIIHSLNKDYHSVKKFPFYKIIEDRKNVILLGDSAEDVQMVDGFDYNNIIKIGFLNENSKGGLAEFKDNYDVIILGDGTMDYILDSFKNAFDVVILNDGPMDYINVLLKELVIERK